jgi:hypothetical protein
LKTAQRIRKEPGESSDGQQAVAVLMQRVLQCAVFTPCGILRG